ncbi:MAG TPA: acetate--CoA ligase [Bacteroidota bacterium]|nr:acetate--CoA ligase [Bacteroidota bacterium]
MATAGQQSVSANITSVLKENRIFKPAAKFSKSAAIKSFAQYKKLYNQSIHDPEKFWGTMADELTWYKKWSKVLRWKLPFAEWFVGGKINVSVNCLDRHLTTWRKNKAAIIWEGEPGDTRTLTYADLHREVCQCANVLKKLGVVKGDRVIIYMPMIPELPVAMLACARIGATHSVIFGGFSSEALKDRINDAQAKLVITADGGYRRGNVIPLKANIDEALKVTPSVESVVVVNRVGLDVPMIPGRDHWWEGLMSTTSSECEPEKLESEHPLYILYTSGTTGKPKGVVHSTAGYLLGCHLTTKYVFDIKDTDTYWCTADIGWVTGHSYIVYGPFSNGATVVMYEGAPNHPEPDRFWSIVEKYKVNVFYTAPTAIRAFIKWGEQWPLKHDLSSIRLLGTVGEPINPEAWMWYSKIIGKGKCPIVDTWWQTETGSIMITPLPGATPTKPGTATLPFFGIQPDVVNKEGKSVGANQGGYLVIKKPWPSMMRGVYRDPERFKKTYWSDIKGMYFTGDGARKDKDGYFWIMGRVDDVINVSGHRLGTMEVESALVSHPYVAEAAVVGKPDEIKGSAICAFVTLEGKRSPTPELKEELRQHVAKEIGAMAKPDDIRFTDALPKTRSGKIMRRLLREIAAGGTATGDTTTLEDFSVLEKLRHHEDEE